MNITLGRILTALAIAGALAALVWALIPRPVLVESATAIKGKFVATVDEDGKTRVRERYVVAAPLAGRLTRVRLKAGDSVKADEAVATIMPSPAPFLDPRSRVEAEQRLGAAEAAHERTTATVERAKAQTGQAKKDLDRIRTLAETGAATAQALERAETAMRVADRDLRAAEFLDHATEHEVEQAKALLARYTDSYNRPPEQWNVTAPVSGLVLKVVQESETMVEPGTPLLDIGDPRDLEIVVDQAPFDVLRSPEVRLDFPAQSRQLHHLHVRERGLFLLRRVDLDSPRASSGERFDREPFRRDGLLHDLVVAHLEHVRVHQTGDERLAEAEARVHGQDLSVPADGIGREQDAGRLRDEHLLQDHGHVDLPVVDAVA